MRRCAICFVICMLSITAAAEGKTITTGSLTEEMVDMVNLTSFPDPY